MIYMTNSKAGEKKCSSCGELGHLYDECKNNNLDDCTHVANQSQQTKYPKDNHTLSHEIGMPESQEMGEKSSLSHMNKTADTKFTHYLSKRKLELLKGCGELYKWGICSGDKYLCNYCQSALTEINNAIKNRIEELKEEIDEFKMRKLSTPLDCSLTDEQRSYGLMCRGMYCAKCRNKRKSDKLNSLKAELEEVLKR